MTAKQRKANDLVKKHALISAGLALVPLPVINAAALIGLQLKLIKNLTEVYEVPFSEDVGKSLVSTLIGGSAPFVAMGLGSLAWGIPIVGPVIAAVSLPALNYASTTAVGRVFTLHFESGGTLLDFDAEKMKKYYAEEFDKAKRSHAETEVRAEAS